MRSDGLHGLLGLQTYYQQAKATTVDTHNAIDSSKSKSNNNQCRTNNNCNKKSDSLNSNKSIANRNKNWPQGALKICQNSNK